MGQLDRKYKILFTGVGRRVELLQVFRRAAGNMGSMVILYGADCSDTAPALYFCDSAHIVCHMEETDYIPQLLQICKNEQIDLIIPTIDTDLLILAKSKDKFAEIGTKVLISDAAAVAVCRDKLQTAQFFLAVG